MPIDPKNERGYEYDTALFKRMKVLGYSITEVSAGARVDRWHMNDYLNKRKPITPLHLARLAAFLKCPAEMLID